MSIRNGEKARANVARKKRIADREVSRTKRAAAVEKAKASASKSSSK